MNQDFYEKCAEILRANHEGEPFSFRKRTRWNNRSPGRGRYPGFGVIRKFGNTIHIALHHPVTETKVFDNEEEFFSYLRSIYLQSNFM